MLTREEVDDRMWAYDLAADCLDGEDASTDSEHYQKAVAAKMIRAMAFRWYNEWMDRHPEHET